MSTNVEIYRKRLIPNEIIHLKDDRIISVTRDAIVTEWEALRQRSDFRYGTSRYCINEGYKISKMYTKDKEYVYTYCDIIRTEQEDNRYVFWDLLVDVVIMPDNSVKVLDLNELHTAYKNDVLSLDDLFFALDTTDRLLKKIYAGELEALEL
ncbi:hypothetical protein AGMMS49975_24280 [Clostridia bacterium]|nr:hypothetical protein AGMMS49975_24280 [Clostridia bacterium]